MQTRPPAALDRSDDALEAAADRLLREDTMRRGAHEYPFYAPSSLRQLSRREDLLSQRDLSGGERRSSRAASVLDQLTPRLNLTEENRALLEMIRAGQTPAEVADRLGLTLKALRRRLDRIVARLRQAAKVEGGYDRLIQQAYDEELHPVRYRPEQHCHRDSQACRNDGRCKFRWYLYRLNAQETE
jgi:DNA-binding CsgD family transcriptional regulator